MVYEVSLLVVVGAVVPVQIDSTADGLPTVRCRCPSQQAFGAEILVEIRPVDAIAAGGDLPVFELVS